MFALLVGLALAQDPAPEAEAEPTVELIPGVRDAGLPPNAVNQLKPATQVPLPPPLPIAGLPPAVTPLSEAGLPTPPPELTVISGLPAPPPPIQQAGLPPMAQPLPMVHGDTPRGAKVILFEDLPMAEGVEPESPAAEPEAE